MPKYRRKTLNRSERLRAGKNWIENYTGKHMISGYAKWFGVDKLCAIAELRMLGVEISESLEKQIAASLEQKHNSKKIKKEENSSDPDMIYGLDYDEDFAFIAGFTSGGAAFGLTHEEYDEDDEIDAELPEEDWGWGWGWGWKLEFRLRLRLRLSKIILKMIDIFGLDS